MGQYGNSEIQPFLPKMIADITPGHILLNMVSTDRIILLFLHVRLQNALIDSKMLIQLGKAELCGGSEAAVTASGVGGFNAMMALSTRNDDPKTASRPLTKTEMDLSWWRRRSFLKNMSTP
jgi:3-oxoacyl-[acyl-carrier-protein] synthase II